MAKKKRKHRNPVAPPVHSAPGTAHAPAGPRTAVPPTTRPEGAEPPVETVAAPRPPRDRKKRPRTAAQRRRRSRQRTYLIIGTIVLVIVAAIFAQRMLSSRAISAFNELAAANECGNLKTTSTSGASEHLVEGERTEYDTSPPTHGKHAQTTLPAGVYDEPLSDDPNGQLPIYRAVHSLEHGAIVIWQDKLSKDDLADLEGSYEDEEKVIVARYPALRGDDHVAMSAWGVSVTCEGMSNAVIDAFIDRYRGARSAPEPNNPI